MYIDFSSDFEGEGIEYFWSQRATRKSFLKYAILTLALFRTLNTKFYG